MDSSGFFNNFNIDSPQFFESQTNVYFIYFLSTFVINIAAYLYVVIRFYKVLCYSTMTFEWLPMINPYIWPFSIFKVLTDPYFRFWAKILPMVKFEDSSLEISGIIALEGLNSCTFFLVRLATFLIPVLEKTRVYISEFPN
jgi:hypothetical protein